MNKEGYLGSKLVPITSSILVASLVMRFMICATLVLLSSDWAILQAFLYTRPDNETL